MFPGEGAAPGSLPEAWNRPTLSVGFLSLPQLHTDTRHSVWDQPRSRSPQSPVCPTTGAGPGDRSQLRQGPLLWRIPQCLVSPGKMYFPLAIHSGPRLGHSPMFSSTYEPSNKVQDGSNHNLFSHLTCAPHPAPNHVHHGEGHRALVTGQES